MKSSKFLILFVFITLFLIFSCKSQNEITKETIPNIPDKTVLIRETPLPLLKVSGNKIIKDGNAFILRGVNIGDINQLGGHLNEEYFYKAAAWGANVIRIPVTPQDYRRCGKDLTFTKLDRAINWSEKYGMYVILDWHSIGNPITMVFLNPKEAYYCTQEEIIDFWKTAAVRYKNKPVVAFYEIFNEPAALNWIKKDDTLDWADWKNFADKIIDVIYKENFGAIPIVGCLQFCKDLSQVENNPLRNKGIVFAIHPYPGSITEPFDESCDDKFGFASEKYPLFLTEVGFDPFDKILPSVYRADTEYGNNILSYAEKKGISWAAYIFYINEYYPMPLFLNWKTYEPTVQGAFFKQKMIESNK